MSHRGFQLHMARPGWIAALLASGVIAGHLRAQGSRTDYERALHFAQQTENTVFRQRVKPVWLADHTRFWYRIATGPDTQEFVLVDAEAGTRRPLFDHARLAAALTKALGTNVPPDRLPMEQVAVEPVAAPASGPMQLRFRAGGQRWVADLPTCELSADALPEATLAPRAGARKPDRSRQSSEDTEITFVNHTADDLELFWLDTDGQRQGYGRVRPGQERAQHTFVGHVFLLADRVGTTVAVFEATDGPSRAVIETKGEGALPVDAPPVPAPEAGVSPDGRWVAFVKDDNLQLRNRTTGEVTPLSRDGTAGEAYRSEVSWAPDSSRLVATRVHPGGDRQVTLVEAAPKDQIQPKLHSHRYLKPGDPLPKPVLRLFTIADRKQVDIEDALYQNPFTEDGDLDIRWAPDSHEFYFNYNQRGHQLYRLLAVNANGSRGEGITSASPRVIVEETARTFIDWTNKTWRHWLDGSGELLWMSERDGWSHLWLYDAKTGRVKNQITKGEWVVRSVEHVDEAKREVWFLAGGVQSEQDPYYLHLCRVSFDGTGFIVLTEGEGTHQVEFSPDRRWFLDTWSRVDQPPVTELRRAADGRMVCELERADASRLNTRGWSPPERFRAKGRDDATDIYGIIIKPSNFDPAKTYPVVEEIYAGPHGAFVPKEFGRLNRQHALAELGFIVVQIDGMGTNHRGKKFQDVAWKNLADAGLPDRIAWLQAAAATRPWMDLSRVGIYGGSAGGQSSTRALLDHGDFYKVAVSDCGCHDNRMDKIWWNEQWLGWPVDDSYVRSSNVADAHKLTGKLLLIVGELDTNVDPASTLQVAAALVRADRDFDLLIMPGSNHGAAESPYGTRRRMDFFVRHLLNREPRWE